MRVPESILAENRSLCESRERQPVREVLAGPVSVVPRPAPTAGVTESKSGNKLYTAKVSQADTVNGNNRIYPTPVLRDNINRLRPLLGQGYLAGAVDHLGMLAGGNLADTAVIWRDLQMLGDGSVVGQFEIVEGHSKGADLAAQLAAGLSVGVSTYGFGSAHAPSDSERAQYGLSPEDEVVIMDAGYVLKKADMVDDPSCPDARVGYDQNTDPNSPANPANDSVKTDPESVKAESVADPRLAVTETAILAGQDQPPAVGGPVVEDKQIMSEANKQPETKAPETPVVETKVETKTVTVVDESARKAINAFVASLKTVEGVELPQREVLPAEVAEQIKAKDAEITGLKAQVESAKAEQSKAEAKVAEMLADKQDLDRRAKAAAKVEELLKDKPAYAVAVKKAAEKRLADKGFDEKAAEALVAETVELLESVRVEVPEGTQPRLGVKGSDAPPVEEKENPLAAVAG